MSTTDRVLNRIAAQPGVAYGELFRMVAPIGPVTFDGILRELILGGRITFTGTARDGNGRFYPSAAPRPASRAVGRS